MSSDFWEEMDLDISIPSNPVASVHESWVILSARFLSPADIGSFGRPLQTLLSYCSKESRASKSGYYDYQRGLHVHSAIAGKSSFCIDLAHLLQE